VVTIKDVARAAGVSYSTVSRVVNGGTGFSAQTRARVEAAVAELGYRPNDVARSLVMQRHSSVAVLMPSVSESFAALVLDGVEEAAEEEGLLVVIGRTAGRPGRAAEYLETMRGHQAVGAILVATVITPELSAAFGAGPLVSVAIDAHNGTRALAVDSRAAARDAVEHLRARGHRRIGFLSGPGDDAYTTAPRLAGYTEAMEAAGLTPVVAFGDYRYASGAAGVAELLAHDPALTAIFAASDELGAAAINALQRSGRRVPEDVSVIGFDDTPVAQHVNPGLTTVAQPLREMGAQAVRLLLAPDGALPEVVPHRVVERESVGPAPRVASRARLASHRPRTSPDGRWRRRP
jgi:LacI family transcriptional regulator